MDRDSNGKKDCALGGVLKTIFLFLDSLQLYSTCSILQTECTQLGYPEVHRSRPHILVLRPSDLYVSTTPNTNCKYKNYNSKWVGTSRVPKMASDVDQDQGFGGDASRCQVDSSLLVEGGSRGNAEDMSVLQRQQISKDRNRDGNNAEGKLNKTNSAASAIDTNLKDMLTRAESVMEEFRLRRHFDGDGGDVQGRNVSVFFADINEDLPNPNHNNTPNRQPYHYQQQPQNQPAVDHHAAADSSNFNLNAQPLCSCCSCIEYAAAMAAFPATRPTVPSSRTALSTETENQQVRRTTPLMTAGSKEANRCPPSACRKVCPTSTCTRNMPVAKLSAEHLKLLAIASKLTHALQSQIRGQSDRIDELLATCRQLCPELFAAGSCTTLCRPCMPITKRCQQLLIADSGTPDDNRWSGDEDDDDNGSGGGGSAENRGEAGGADGGSDSDDGHIRSLNNDLISVKGHEGTEIGKRLNISDCMVNAMAVQNQHRAAVSESSFNSQDNYGPELDFKKIKRHLQTKSSQRKLLLLQALRWRLTKSDNDYRDHTLNSYIRNDLLGLNTTDATAFLARFLGDTVTEEHDILQETMARLVNTFASLTLGRDYLSFDGQVIVELLIPILIGPYPNEVAIKRKTREFLIATLQKLSLRAKIRKVMISRGMVQFLLDYLSENLDNMNSYSMEYTTALLMNLCLQTEAREICSSKPTQIVQLMKYLLKSPYQCCLLYVNGIMYSLLKDPIINKEAIKAKLANDLNAAIELYHDNTELRRQFEVILALHSEYADPDLEHACANAEPDEELDIIELELDLDDDIVGHGDILYKYRIKIDEAQTAIETCNGLTALCNPATPRSARSPFRPNSSDSTRSDNIKNTSHRIYKDRQDSKVQFHPNLSNSNQIDITKSTSYESDRDRLLQRQQQVLQAEQSIKSSEFYNPSTEMELRQLMEESVRSGSPVEVMEELITPKQARPRFAEMKKGSIKSGQVAVSVSGEMVDGSVMSGQVSPGAGEMMVQSAANSKFIDEVKKRKEMAEDEGKTSNYGSTGTTRSEITKNKITNNFISEVPSPGLGTIQSDVSKETNNVLINSIEKELWPNLRNSLLDQHANKLREASDYPNTFRNSGSVTSPIRSGIQHVHINEPIQETGNVEQPKSQISMKSTNSTDITDPSLVSSKTSQDSGTKSPRTTESTLSRDTSKSNQTRESKSIDKVFSHPPPESDRKAAATIAKPRTEIRASSAPSSQSKISIGSKDSGKTGQGVVIAVASGKIYEKISGPSKYTHKDSACIELGRVTDAQLAKIRRSLDSGRTLEEALQNADVRTVYSGAAESLDTDLTICCSSQIMRCDTGCNEDCVTLRQQTLIGAPQTGCRGAEPLSDTRSEKTAANTDMGRRYGREKKVVPNEGRKPIGPFAEQSGKHTGALCYGVNYPDPLDVHRKVELAKCERTNEVARKRFCARANQQCLATKVQTQPAWCCSIRPPKSFKGKIPVITRPVVPPLLQSCYRPDGKALAHATRCSTETLRNCNCDCYQEIRSFLACHHACGCTPNQNCGRNDGLYGLKRCCRDRSQ